MAKNWKDKLKEMGIEIKKVRRVDGSEIEGWYTYEYKELPVFTYVNDGIRTFQVGNPLFPPYADKYDNKVKGRFSCINFDKFMDNIEDYVAGTPGNKRIVDKFRKVTHGTIG